MAGFVKLGDYASVVAHKAQMQDVFTRPEDDARYMPVTRDLSPAKREMILNWLQTTGNAGQPNLGKQTVAEAGLRETSFVATASRSEGDIVTELGGKSAALRSRGELKQLGFVKRRL